LVVQIILGTLRPPCFELIVFLKRKNFYPALARNCRSESDALNHGCMRFVSKAHIFFKRAILLVIQNKTESPKIAKFFFDSIKLDNPFAIFLVRKDSCLCIGGQQRFFWMSRVV